ncbi:MAG: hypothetical protein ACI9WO_002155 [Sphingobacteriales bacterium]|jgi:hypothetical protein
MSYKEIGQKFKSLTIQLGDQFADGEAVDLKGALFLIGVQELGQGARKYSKREKEELMHIAVCRLMSELGYYTLSGLDDQGWPHWEKTKNPPHMHLVEQESLLKQLIVDYFEKIDYI